MFQIKLLITFDEDNSTLLLKFYLLGMRKIFTSVSGLFPSPRGGKHGLEGHFEITSEASDFKGSERPCLPPSGLGNKPLTLVKILSMPKRLNFNNRLLF